ncbi:MAG: amidase, partial [Gammaproteobacteria bacterium]
MFSEYQDYDALGLAELVRNREINAEQVLDAAIARAEAVNDTLNAIVYPMYDEARRALSSGLPDGPLAGVPFLLKDLHLACKGVPTSNGSKLFDGFVPDFDNTLVERHRAAGLLIIGKTNTPELGICGSTEPVRFGPTRNPWNVGHSAGGSSGGSAAAAAAGVVPLAHATDGGGSIRIPASFTGCVGLKPSFGRVPHPN